MFIINAVLSSGTVCCMSRYHVTQHFGQVSSQRRIVVHRGWISGLGKSTLERK
jgi:hypothetical protein